MTIHDYTVAELTPGVVTSMLRTTPEWADAAVAQVKSTAVGTGQMASSYRLDLDYERQPTGAPDTLIAKMPSTDPTSRQMALATGAYLREICFYRSLAALTTARTPACHFADITSDSLGFVLLLEDMGPARTIDQLAGCTPDQAELALAQAADLHGPTWGHPALKAESWLSIADLWSALAGSIPQVTGMWLERFGKYLRPEHLPVIEECGSHVSSWLATLRDSRCLWHGDFRLDNLLFDAQDGRTPVVVVDWQSVSSGPGIADVSYFLGNSLSEADRMATERALVTSYHRRLLAHGVQGYSLDQCWHEYRAHAIYGLMLSIPISLGVQPTERGDRMFAAMADRAANQMLVNDTFAALKEL